MANHPATIQTIMSNEEPKQERKNYAKRGEREQKMMSFRADAEVVGILQRVANKGRLLNDLVKEWNRSRNRLEHDDGPASNEIEEYMT